MSRGLTLEDARKYNIIGCVEPQVAGKTDGWHDAAFFNMCRPLEMVFKNGYENGKQVGLKTGEVEDMQTDERSRYKTIFINDLRKVFKTSAVFDANNK